MLPLLILALFFAHSDAFFAARKETTVAGPRSDLGCATVSNSQWQRCVPCFPHECSIAHEL